MKNNPYWHNELQKAVKTMEKIKISNLDDFTKAYLLDLLEAEIQQCKFGIKYIGD